MGHEIAFYEVVEIIIGLIALGLAGFSYYQDSIWNAWLSPFGLNLGKMCEAFGKRTSDLVPLLTSSGYLGDAEVGKIHMKMIYRNAAGETWFIGTEVVTIIFTFVHVLYSCKSKRIILRAKYGAYIHALAFIFLVPTTLALATTAFEIENIYKVMASYHPQCSNIIFCQESNDLQDENSEIDDNKKEDIKDILTDNNICQLFWVKVTASVFGAVHAAISFGIFFVAMSVITKYEEGVVADSTISEELEDFFRTIAKKPSKIRYETKSALQLNKSNIQVNKCGSGACCNRSFHSNHKHSSSGMLSPASNDDDERSSSGSIVHDYFQVARKLSPVTMYREYKFRKQRIAELEREQNMVPDRRLSMTGWDYDIDTYYEQNMQLQTGHNDPNAPKRVFRKPKLVRLQKNDENQVAGQQNSSYNNIKPAQVNPNIPEIPPNPPNDQQNPKKRNEK